MNLLKLSFIISILGILILIIISINLQPKLTNIDKLTDKHLNKQILIQGKITNIKTINPNFHLITLKDSTSEITAIINNPSTLNIDQTIILIGRLTKYKNELQIQTNKIIKSIEP